MSTSSLPFDPFDAPPGYIALPYEAAAGGCLNCDFRSDPRCLTSPCMPLDRDDEQPAIFQLCATQTYMAKTRGCDSCVFSPSSACRNCPYYQGNETLVIYPTPEELADEFTNMNDEQQAMFFNAVAAMPEKYGFQWCFQLAAVSSNPTLSAEARAWMRELGEYAEEVLS